MTTRINPYVAGNPVGDSPAFIGRADVLREVVRVLRRPQDNAIVLYGQRRIGKTSILQHLRAQLAREGPYRPVYFDLQDKAALPLGQVLRDLARTIAHALGQPDPDLGADPETTFRQTWLPATLSSLPADAMLVLLLDEFDVLADPKAEQAAAAFFPYLRELLALDPQRLNFVFVIGRNVNDLTNIALSLFKGIPSQRVSLLSEPDTAELARLSQKNGTLNWPDDAVARVWQLTHGHPFLTQQLCSHVWERVYDQEPDEPPVATPTNVDVAVPEALEASRNTMEWLWDGLPPAERVVISALAEAGPGCITQEDLERILRESGVRVLIRELQNAPQLLQDWDLVEPADGGYRFRVELLRQWIVEHKPLHWVQEELDRIEPVAEDLYQAALALYNAKRLDETIEVLQRVIVVNPNHVAANQLLVEVLIIREKIDEASQVLERLYQFDPDVIRSRLVQVLLIRARKTPDENEQVRLYERVMELDPTDSESKAKIAELRQSLWHRTLKIGLQEIETLERSERYQEALDLVKKLAQEYQGARNWASEQQRLERKKERNDLFQEAREAYLRGQLQKARSLQKQAEALELDESIPFSLDNPFSPDQPAYPKQFIDRQIELSLLRKFVGARGRSVVVVGELGSGKSSLLRFIASTPPQQIFLSVSERHQVCICLNREDWKTIDTLADFWKLALDPFFRRVGSSGSGFELVRDYKVCEENDFPVTALEFLFSQVKRHEWQLVLLLDDFEQLFEHQHLNSSEFFGSLSSLASRYSPALTLVIATRFSFMRLNEVTRSLNPFGSPYFGFLEPIDVGPLPNRYIEDLLDRAKGRFNSEDRRFIFDMAGGHPYLLQLVASSLWEKREADLALRRQKTQEGLREKSYILSEITSHWSKAERKALVLVALAHINARKQRKGFLEPYKLNIGELIQDMRLFSRELNSLKQRGFVAENKSIRGGWQVKPQLFLWWLSNELLLMAQEQKPSTEWLAPQEWQRYVTPSGKHYLDKTLSTSGELLKDGIKVFIESVAKGLVEGLSKGSTP